MSMIVDAEKFANANGRYRMACYRIVNSRALKLRWRQSLEIALGKDYMKIAKSVDYVFKGLFNAFHVDAHGQWSKSWRPFLAEDGWLAISDHFLSRKWSKVKTRTRQRVISALVKAKILEREETRFNLDGKWNCDSRIRVLTQEVLDLLEVAAVTTGEEPPSLCVTRDASIVLNSDSTTESAVSADSALSACEGDQTSLASPTPGDSLIKKNQQATPFPVFLSGEENEVVELLQQSGHFPAKSWTRQNLNRVKRLAGNFESHRLTPEQVKIYLKMRDDGFINGPGCDLVQLTGDINAFLKFWPGTWKFIARNLDDRPALAAHTLHDTKPEVVAANVARHVQDINDVWNRDFTLPPDKQHYKGDLPKFVKGWNLCGDDSAAFYLSVWLSSNQLHTDEFVELLREKLARFVSDYPEHYLYAAEAGHPINVWLEGTKVTESGSFLKLTKQLAAAMFQKARAAINGDAEFYATEFPLSYAQNPVS